MKRDTGRRKDSVVRRAFVLGVSFVLFALQPTLGGAAVITETYSHAQIEISPAFVDFYTYAGATTISWADSAAFDTGTYAETNSTDVADSIVLDRIGPAVVAAPDPSIGWWNTDWTNRRCFEIDHTAAGAVGVTEYPIRVPFPIDPLVTGGYLQADLGDIRAIGADGVTSLPLWQDDTEPDTLWIQVDAINAATTETVCVYFGYAPGTAASPPNHSEASVFTYTTAKAVYYTVSDVFSAPSADINVVSYIDGNEVTRDTDSAVPLAGSGDLSTFTAAGNTQGTVFSVLGPISAAGMGDGADSLVPISFAGTAFVSPVSRDAQTFSFVAPFADATVELYDGPVLVNTFTVTAGTPYTHVADDISDGNAATILADVPVLVTHRSATGGDAFALYPATLDAFYAVRSTEALIGFGTDGTSLTAAASDGTSATTAGDSGDVTIVGGGGTQGGVAGDGLLLTADQPIGVVGGDDGDGSDSVVALPLSELNAAYWLPTSSEYVALSCPTEESADVALTITPPGTPSRPVTCTGGTDVAWAVDTADLVVTTSGTSVATDTPAVFAAYYEDLATDDQIGLLGMKQGRQYTWPEPVITPGGDEGIYATSGSWESVTFDTGATNEAYGLIGLEGAEPAGTVLGLQIATAATGTPTAFVGPDGTSGTYYTLSSLPAVADFAHDGDQLLRVRAELTTTDPANVTPRLDLASVDYALPRLDRSLAAAPVTSLITAIDPTVNTTYLLRVGTGDAALNGSEATAVYRGAANLANLAEESIRFVNEALGVNSVQQSTTLPTDPPEVFQPDRPHSVVLDHSALGAGTTSILFAWQLDFQGSGSIYFETDFAVEVTAP